MSVVYPRGFQASAISAGLKAPGILDMALVSAARPVPAAGVFTSNRVFAAPVALSRDALSNGMLRAVVLNSGGANAATGERGLADSQAEAQEVADSLPGAVSQQDVAVCSTGVIGDFLPMDLVLPGIRKLAESLGDDGESPARAIMTTDTVPKLATTDCGEVRFGGMAKGAGMLAPALATMLCVITTDVVIEPVVAQRALSEAVRTTFNRADGDGCMSTNDTVLLLASGDSGVQLSETDFTETLRGLCYDLAGQLLADAEGASHLVNILVIGANSEDDAEQVARQVARSNLVKCAIYGNDPNWGRILSEVGTVRDATFDAEHIDIAINGVLSCRNSVAYGERSRIDMSQRDIDIVIDLHSGSASAEVRTTDLTVEYVHINADYTS
ncbi:MAG: bifunctional glutamate N-acetyltransferase/amino-acid acetyltransferase ArgJ [Varibaculum sp.]|nr:bifunctional glutamate N-acetyltransferase/amino-acid acetyltransferase ArgJ [Varibaculum sp.]